MLHVECIDANLTHNTELFGKMDPFVKITSGQLAIQTKVCEKGGRKPTWNQTLHIDPYYLEDVVKITVLDQDLNKKDIVGFCKVLKADLMSEQPVERKLDLIFGPKEKPAGTLRIKSHCTTNTKAEDIIQHVVHKATAQLAA